MTEGIVIPPPDIKGIIETTAAYVARSGPHFEDRIRENEKHNPRFCFLNPNDPYRAYYDFKIAEARGEVKAAQKTAGKPIKRARVEEKASDILSPPPPYEFLYECPPVSAQDLDIIRLTAMFVAKNGRQFMTELAQREQRNSQFDFLRPNHTLFGYFSSLVGQYGRVIHQDHKLLAKLTQESTNRYAIIERIKKRVDYTLYQNQLKKMAEEEAIIEKQAFESIDWHDFVIVETIDFTQADQDGMLPIPMQLSELETIRLTRSQDLPDNAIQEEEEMEMDIV